MIKILANESKVVAEEIHSIYQSSYAVEAKLLKAIDFPPLKRPISDFLKSGTEFYGYLDNEKLAAVIEIQREDETTHIHSLVVHPNYFRQGIGRQLVQYILDAVNSKVFTVETGVANEPAIRLYQEFGFVETKQWDTDLGIRKIRFELRANNLKQGF